MNVSIRRARKAQKPEQASTAALDSLSWSDLRALAKEKGINTFGKSRSTIEHELSR